jgi:hypothetical protein
MKYEELELAMNEPLLSKDLLTEALMVRVALHECPEKTKTGPMR